MAAVSETTPLSGDKALYFIPRNRTFTEEVPAGKGDGAGGGGGGVELKNYAPKIVDRPVVDMSRQPARRGGNNLWSWFTGYTPIGDDDNEPAQRASLPRKVPVKVEPKVFFANERTYLAWIHMAVVLGTISVGIVALADNDANGKMCKMYGVMLMPVAIAFAIYALHMYLKRTAMLMRRDPGPFHDLVGPTVLGVIIVFAIIVNIAIKLFALHHGI